MRIVLGDCLGIMLLVILHSSTMSRAQEPVANAPGTGQGQGQPQTSLVGGPQGLGSSSGAAGGAASADFDSLIDLITSTVDADTWMENGTGQGEVQPFPNGVYADAKGTLRFKQVSESLEVGYQPPTELATAASEVRQTSRLRFISLPRLEATIQSRQRLQQPLSEAMLTLAGLQRVEHVFVVPAKGSEPGDLVLAGPAGDWRVQTDGKIVALETGQPVVRLDDLLTLWRRHLERNGAAFGVSINPRQANLANVQEYVRASNTQPLEFGERDNWLTGLQQELGQQDVEFFGIEPDSHVARVLLVADYHMKLIGMGLAEGVEGVESYLSTVSLGADGSVPPMTVLRWWFAMQYHPIQGNLERTSFHLQGPGAKVLSENEWLAARGRRIHTGASEQLNRRFASSFSDSFGAICQKHPLYTELRNVFDLSLVLALFEHEGLVERAGWQPTSFANAALLPLPPVRLPSTVETVINHRVIRRKHIIAGVSGGVWIDARKTLKVEEARIEAAKPKAVPSSAINDAVWWWD